MVDKIIPVTITEQIDADEGLKSKRKLLTITSLILLALSFSGAKVEEANSFVLKLSFDNDRGIATLLVLVIIMLLIRYYNYAYQYHQVLYRLWSKRLLDDPYFWSYHSNSDDISGLIYDLAPNGMNFEVLSYSSGTFSFGYATGTLFFGRKIEYYWSDDERDPEESFQAVSVGWRNYFKVLRLEMRYQAESFFVYRENLDILAPYFLGIIAILSYFFSDWLIAIL